ncbi:hypothetical protein DDB_G0269342 [Dictyostelium discoideum AX4]|uniref:Uncharacterized protein n=1 Tax=Dictyostelium discoideum TaxID=44689 RepID=Q55E91_DICDI|nr:hypothetical protein DDB_G0269342 [Dictyostelium discoideum AX4]EAL72021.1 hypothetical protein DDB_G0269342 [Dictyostelium discoideum AX4]|eukprot:XP_645890.1 hypothetical protein DDB_G0269342 [Dictyostelium discoideum AX4]
MTKTDDIPIVFIEKKNIQEKILEIDVDKKHKERIAKSYEYIVNADKTCKEHLLLQEILDQCFFKQKQSYMKNCRPIVMEYLDKISKMDESRF